MARHLSPEPVILLGHDWGAPIVYATALLHPGAVRAVAGLSVPFTSPGPQSFLDLAERRFANRFFYQLYFQEEGVAEARKLEADVPASAAQNLLRALRQRAAGPVAVAAGTPQPPKPCCSA